MSRRVKTSVVVVAGLLRCGCVRGTWVLDQRLRGWFSLPYRFRMSSFQFFLLPARKSLALNKSHPVHRQNSETPDYRSTGHGIYEGPRTMFVLQAALGEGLVVVAVCKRWLEWKVRELDSKSTTHSTRYQHPHCGC